MFRTGGDTQKTTGVRRRHGDSWVCSPTGIHTFGVASLVLNLLGELLPAILVNIWTEWSVKCSVGRIVPSGHRTGGGVGWDAVWTLD